MKPLSWDKQLGLASPLESAAGQSNQNNNPSMDKDEAVDKGGLDASHHTRIFLRGGENLFFLTSSFIGRLANLSSHFGSSRNPSYWTVMDRELDRESGVEPLANSDSCSSARRCASGTMGQGSSVHNNRNESKRSPKGVDSQPRWEHTPA